MHEPFKIVRAVHTQPDIPDREEQSTMQIIISPAKQMQTAIDAFVSRSIPPFPRETACLHEALLDLEQNGGPKDLQKLWNVSDRLLDENLQRLHGFVPVGDNAMLDDPTIASRVSPALFSYIGIQYRSMAPEVMDGASLEWLQDHLWILSGLYGCVRPFDAVEPYRLEMSAKMEIESSRNLYSFWGDRLARAIISAGGIVVNLASVEYAKAVLPHLPPTVRVVTPIFAENLRAGKPVQRSTASKVARGSMVRWMAERSIEDPSQIDMFDLGYVHVPELDATRIHAAGAIDNTLVFLNKKTATDI